MAACIIKRGSLYDHTLSDVANLYSTDSSLQATPPPPLPIYSNTLKEAFIHMGGKIIYFTDLKNQTFVLEIKSRWVKDIIKEGARKIA